MAEASFPSFSAFAEIPESDCIRTENTVTATLQCKTEREKIESYRLLLADSGFISCGSWKLPAGEGYEYAELNAYITPEMTDGDRFEMEIPNERNILCHLFVQHFRLTDGTSFVAITWARGITCRESVSVRDEEAEKDSATGKWVIVSESKPCPLCNHTGICRMCHGDKQVRDYMTEIFTGEECWKPCENCGGTGNCQKCHGSGIMETSYKIWQDGNE